MPGWSIEFWPHVHSLFKTRKATPNFKNEILRQKNSIHSLHIWQFQSLPESDCQYYPTPNTEIHSIKCQAEKPHFDQTLVSSFYASNFLQFFNTFYYFQIFFLKIYFQIHNKSTTKFICFYFGEKFKHSQNRPTNTETNTIKKFPRTPFHENSSPFTTLSMPTNFCIRTLFPSSSPISFCCITTAFNFNTKPRIVATTVPEWLTFRQNKNAEHISSLRAFSVRSIVQLFLYNYSC